MGIKLSELASRTRSIVVPYDTNEGTVDIAITYRLGERASASFERDTEEDPWLLRALVSWDIVDDDGEPVEITREVVASLPGGGRPIIAAILKDDLAGEAQSS